MINAVGGNFANGAATAAFASLVSSAAQSANKKYHASASERPEKYTKEFFGEAPEDAQAVFDEALTVAKDNPQTQLPKGATISDKFIDQYGVGTCSNSACDTVTAVKPFKSLDSAIDYANANPDRIFVDGISGDRTAWIYKGATHTSSYTLQNGPFAGRTSHLTNVGHTLQTIAHEVGHLHGEHHGSFDLGYRERRALEHYSGR